MAWSKWSVPARWRCRAEQSKRVRVKSSVDSAVAAFDRVLESEGSDSRGRRIVSVTVKIDPCDPAAIVFASRMADDEWFCWSNPEAGVELAGLGVAGRIDFLGPDRFERIDREALDRLAPGRLVADPVGGPPGTGPVWVGGFGFDPVAGGERHWARFPPASMVLPEVSLSRSAGRFYLTVNRELTGGGADDVDAAREAVRHRIATLRDRALPLLDPHLTVKPEISGAHPPEHFERAVESAVGRIRSNPRLHKVVLAREIRVTAAQPYRPDAVFGALREGFPSCFVFCRGTPDGTFLGASPELLIRRSGASAVTVALAGSTRRSADPAMDDHLGEALLRSEKDRREQEIVVQRVVKALRPHSVWVEAAAEPGLAKVANIQHLATPIVAQLAESRSAVELAGVLHPTPAVGGEPWSEAASVVSELEGIDRGWYASPVGWMDATGDGEFCVALRSALLEGRTAHLYAGVGIVAGSTPESELAETEMKLSALLPLFES